jgi:hypothetical protein
MSEAEQALKEIEDKIDTITRITEEIMSSIWNAALEDAALTAEKYEANMIAYEIRMRKKK